MRHYKEMPLDPRQLMLFGQSVDDAVPADCEVRAYADVMMRMDYSCVEARDSEVGCPPYPPDVMVKILGYAYASGIRSSRKIESHLHFDVRFIWLAGGLKPDHNTIARFRKDHCEELKELFRCSSRLCCQAGLVSLSVVSVDGTKIASAASRKQIYDKGRLDREIAAIEKVLAEAEEADRVEDESGCGSGACVLPERLRDANVRKAKLDEAAEELEASSSKYVVVSEPESRVMKTGAGTRPAYNMQTCVDGDSQVIVAMELLQAVNDYGQMPRMASAVESTIGMIPDVLMGDAGYPDESSLAWADGYPAEVLMPVGRHWREEKRKDAFSNSCFEIDEVRDVLICPAGKKLTFRAQYWTGSAYHRRYECSDCKSCRFARMCVSKGRGNRRISLLAGELLRRKMREKLKTEEGRNLYRLRGQTVEPVFGQCKSNRGFNRFLAHGLKGAQAECALVCMSHNVFKLIRSAAGLAGAAATSASLHVIRSGANAANSITRWLRGITDHSRSTIPALQVGF
jgi:transposase